MVRHRGRIGRLQKPPAVKFDRGNVYSLLRTARELVKGCGKIQVRLPDRGFYCFIHRFRDVRDFEAALSSLNFDDMTIVRSILSELIKLRRQGTIIEDSTCDLQQAYTAVDQCGNVGEAVQDSLKSDPLPIAFTAPNYPIQTGLRIQQPAGIEDFLRTAGEEIDRGNAGRAADAYEEAAVAEQESGNLPQALEYWEKALEQRRPGKATGQLAFCLEETAKIAFILGDFHEALGYWEEALVIREKTDKRGSIVYVIEEIAKTCKALGEMDKALSYWHKAREIREPHLGKPVSFGFALEEIAKIHESRDELDQALSYWRRALEQYQAGNCKGREQVAEINISRLEEALKETSTS